MIVALREAPTRGIKVKGPEIEKDSFVDKNSPARKIHCLNLIIKGRGGGCNTAGVEGAGINNIQIKRRG